MRIGIPKEIKDHENRVALLPEAVKTLVRAGHQVFVQNKAGEGAGYSDAEYRKAGARLFSSPARIYALSELIIKVKEPLPVEFKFFRSDLRLFCFLHLAPNPRLTKALLKSGGCALAFETLENASGQTPLLMPMSEIAGRLSVMLGAHYLQRNYGGRGVLLSSTHFSPSGEVVIIGGGSVGRAAAEVAWGLKAKVKLLDLRLDHIKNWAKPFDGIELEVASSKAIAAALSRADLAVGAAYVHGAETPKLITKKMVQAMPKGSVLMDVAVDQGGVSETTRPTTISNPIYLSDGVVHCAVTNIPALVSRTASQALSACLLPYVLRVAQIDDSREIRSDPELKNAVNICFGEIVHPQLKLTQ